MVFANDLVICMLNMIIVLFPVVLSKTGNNTNNEDSTIFQIIWSSLRSEDKILGDLAGDGRFQGEGRDKQRLILSDRQRRAALVWQVSCSFNASATWRQNPACLSIKGILLKHRATLAWLDENVELNLALKFSYLVFVCFVSFLFVFPLPHSCCLIIFKARSYSVV